MVPFREQVILGDLHKNDKAHLQHPNPCAMCFYKYKYSVSSPYKPETLDEAPGGPLCLKQQGQAPVRPAGGLGLEALSCKFELHSLLGSVRNGHMFTLLHNI